jgi:cardiolipin synthase
MPEDVMVHRFSNSPTWFAALLKDIARAKKLIYLETFRFTQEHIAQELVTALKKKAAKGVKIRLLLDDWGTTAKPEFFASLIKEGGQVKYFKKLKLSSQLISYNHRRNHQKVVIIDDDITYIGSANIIGYGSTWRECIVRLKHKKIAEASKKFFLYNFNMKQFPFTLSKKRSTPVQFKTMALVRDVPSLRFQRIRNKLKHYIRKAKKEIIIETPYFVPDPILLYHLAQAVKRGVSVIIIIPKKSDVKLVDILMKSTYGQLHKQGMQLRFYHKGFNHAKVSLFDKKYFCLGSSNFDYRSFVYQYELNICGVHPKLVQEVQAHVQETLKHTEPFNFAEWKNRSYTHRFFEWLLAPFKEYF